MVNMCENLLAPASVATNGTSVVLATTGTTVIGQPFCMPTIELEVFSTLCDGAASGGTEFDDPSCELGAIIPTADED
jgi:hypothetical protein